MTSLLHYCWCFFFARLPQTPGVLKLSPPLCPGYSFVSSLFLSTFKSFSTCAFTPLTSLPIPSLCICRNNYWQVHLCFKTMDLWTFPMSSFIPLDASWLNVSPFLDLPSEINMPQPLFLAELQENLDTGFSSQNSTQRAKKNKSLGWRVHIEPCMNCCTSVLD